MDEAVNWSGIGDDDDKEEEGNEFQYFSGRDAIILLIDCSKNMFNDNEDGNPFELSLKCAKNLMCNKIISSDKDLIGVIFFGTETSKNPSDFKHVTVFQELDQPGAERIQELDRVIKGGATKFQKDFGHNSNYSLSDALWACSSMFSQSTKTSSERILLFTNNDDPHRGDAQLDHQAKRRAADLAERGINLDLMHMKNSRGFFDVQKFYRALIHTLDDDADLPDPSSKFEELLARVRTKHHQKRRLNLIKLTLAEGVDVGAAIYTLVRPTSVPFAVRLSKDNNDTLRSLRRTFVSETGEILFPSDMRKVVEYGGKNIKFDVEEVREIRKICEPGLVVLGFKPKSCIKLQHYTKPSNFLYPDEEVITGSTEIFSGLLTKCLERDQVIICRCTPRSNSTAQLAALIPQDEELDENKVQITPPGFHVLVLPYADDIRKMKFDESESVQRADQNQIDKASKIIKKLQFNYDPDSFENPVLQTHWKNIEALALDLDNREEVVDYTRPDDAMIDKRAGSLIKEFKEMIFPSDYDPGIKRKSKSKDATSPKRNKTDKELTDQEIENLAKTGQLHKLTVDVLKTFCSRNNVKVNKRKADILASIYSFYGLTPPNDD